MITVGARPLLGIVVVHIILATPFMSGDHLGWALSRDE